MRYHIDIGEKQTYSQIESQNKAYVVHYLFKLPHHSVAVGDKKPTVAAKIPKIAPEAPIITLRG
jgi:hypothetical protein